MKPLHFTRKEFTCECGCGFDTMDYVLLVMLEVGRDYFTNKYGKVKIVITSGNRCRAHNEDVQKKYVKNYVPFSSNSQHITGKAVDHKYYKMLNDEWVQIDSDEIYDYYDEKYDNIGLGKYSNRTHLDSRGSNARW